MTKQEAFKKWLKEKEDEGARAHRVHKALFGE